VHEFRRHPADHCRNDQVNYEVHFCLQGNV
jgi:hypothetical protein